ncbi:MAG: AAA family ATPase [Ignavibacteria bacterium]|nr:AAA family ATPase [Ignavibacteria bacterium]
MIYPRHTLKKIEDRKIIYSKFIEINYKLISNFNIHLIYCIKKDNKTGEIFLKNKENNKIPFSNSSSGFIQLFPVIVLCSFFKGFITKDLEIFFPYFPKSTYHTSVFFENLDNDVYFSTLLTEQPELHLHPKLQSELAILFADTINKTSGYGNMIIETHSEHLIRKIQVLIARGELDRSKLSVQYFNNENGITK